MIGVRMLAVLKRREEHKQNRIHSWVHFLTQQQEILTSSLAIFSVEDLRGLQLQAMPDSPGSIEHILPCGDSHSPQTQISPFTYGKPWELTKTMLLGIPRMWVVLQPWFAMHSVMPGQA